MDEVVLAVHSSGQARVVRVGDTVRRPLLPSSPLVASLLGHLESVGFPGSPRFLGVDDQGRQVLTFVEGVVSDTPSWQHDDRDNARQIGLVGRLVQGLHTATATFEPPQGLRPQRALPMPGAVWSHGDVGYHNVVYRNGAPAALIDWEFAAPADALCDLAALLALGVRGPKEHASDNERRGRAVWMTLEALVSACGLDDETASRLPSAAAIILDDAAQHWAEQGRDADMVAAARWRAHWFRTQSSA